MPSSATQPIASSIMRRIQVQLRELASIHAGHPFRGKIQEFQDGEALVVQLRNVTDGSIDWSSCIRTTLGSGRAPDCLVTGDLLVAARGGRYHAVEVTPHSEGCVVAAPQFFLVRVWESLILPRFLRWFINQAPCQNYLHQYAEGSYTKSIRRQVLESLPIIAPPLEQQTRWVTLIDSLEEERRLLNKRLANNTELQSSLANTLITKYGASIHGPT